MEEKGGNGKEKYDTRSRDRRVFPRFFQFFSRNATDLQDIASGKPVGVPPADTFRQGGEGCRFRHRLTVGQYEWMQTPGCGVAR